MTAKRFERVTIAMLEAEVYQSACMSRILSVTRKKPDTVLRQEIGYCPNPIRQARFHRRSNAQRAVNTANVVVGEVQAERCPVILGLLTECIHQPRKAADLYQHCEVLALEVQMR
jgi:hypothetical protein